MNSANAEEDSRRNRLHLLLIAVTTGVAILVSLYCLFTGRFIVFQNLFYIPIILSCMCYMMKGFAYSVCLAVLYMLLIVSFTSESSIIEQALARVVLFVAIAGVVTFLSTRRKRAEEERAKLVLELQESLEKVRMLSGLLPICAACKKIRNDQGYWEHIETYIRDHSEADFSHDICPECAERLYPEYYKKK